MELTPNVVILWVGLLVAAVTDLQTGKIRNWLTFSLMATGIVYHGIVGPDRLFGLAGFGAATALHFLLYVGGVQKAGDAKLFMAIGALLGMEEMVETTIWFFLLYMPVGLTILALKGRLTNFLATISWIARKTFGLPVEEAPEPTMMIAGPTILVAGLLAGTTDSIREWVFG
ncbi:MAG: A24 family peptidase [Myxococcota bacterium]